MSDFKTILVRDSVIGDITPDMDFAVKSGASQTTYQPFPSTSASNSALIWNVQVPSENVVIGRDVLINTPLVVELSITNVPIGATAFAYGLTDSFQAFPLNNLFTTATAQINNTTCSINSRDVLPSILRMNNSRELYRYNSMTPALPDQAYALYSDAVNSSNNPLASYNNASYDLDQVPRGSHPVIINVKHTKSTGGTDTSLISTNTADTWSIGVATIVSEPIFLSPFIWGNPEYNCQGLLGINNMAFTFNLDSTCSRVWSTSNPYITSIVLGSPNAFVQQSAFTLPALPAGQAQTALLSASSATGPRLLFKFLSTQPSDLVQTKNIVPYMDFPRYLTSSANNPNLTAGASATTIVSSNLQINQIPDYFIITARIPMSQQTWVNSMSQFVINGISVNLNNQSGLLSSASQYDLWRTSAKNGSTQSWAEFSGQASSFTAGVAKTISTTGSVLVLSPPYDLSLPNYISSGSLGNYNFQFQLQVSNQFPTNLPVEICVVCVNSGIFSTQQGVSAVYTGILTKEMVLSAVNSGQASSIHSQEASRMIGGQLLNGALTAYKGMRRHTRHMGGAVSAGAMGASSSGGRMKKFC
jgi:hypothetical protein